MWSRYSNYTTCIRCNDLIAIEQALTNLFEQEEWALRLSQLPPLAISLEQLRGQYTWNQSCNLWIVSLFAGQEGWTIIKTWPNELLCHRASDDSRPQLSTLAMQLGCDAFHLEVYNDISGILLEASANGQIYTAGTFGPNIPPERFYQQPIDAPGLIQQFSLLEVPEQMQAAMRVNEDPEIARREAEYDRLWAEENRDWELLNALEYEEGVGQGYTERIDRTLKAVLTSSDSWYCSPLAHYVYAWPEELAAAGAHLLYFLPPPNYKLPSAYTLTPAQWLEIFGQVPVED